MTRRRCARVNWSAWQHEIETALRRCGDFPDSVKVDGRLERRYGLNHENFFFRIRADEPLGEAGDVLYMLRAIGHECPDDSRDDAWERLETEAGTLRALAGHDLGFDVDVPRFVCYTADQPERRGFIETGISAIPLEFLRKFPARRGYLIEAIARVAAAIHSLPTEAFDFLPSHADSAAHVRAELADLSDEFLDDNPVAAEAAAWIRDHLPDNRPAAVLHGDLLPQNILYDDVNGHLGVVDWEYAKIGDPAYDLAIVTRGNRKLFGADGGKARLINDYRRAGGAEVTPADVMIHEMLMVLGWMLDATERRAKGDCQGHGPEQHALQLGAMLRRASGYD